MRVNLQELHKAKANALRKYQSEKASIALAIDPVSLQRAAQAANDAWLEIKKIDVELSQGTIIKTLGDLYGC